MNGLIVKALSADGGTPMMDAAGTTDVKVPFCFSNLSAGGWELRVEDWNRVGNFQPMRVTVTDQNDLVELSVTLKTHR